MNPAILRFALETSRMNPAGLHHLEHWTRVYQFGMLLCDLNPDADREVVGAFALLHDVARVNEGYDPRHGHRAVELLRPLGELFEDFEDGQRKKLFYAIEYHSDGRLAPNDTVGVCWDADRLDLPRVGIIPATRLMSTQAAQALASGMVELA